MLATTIKKFRDGLTPDCMEGVPAAAIAAFADLLASLYPLTLHCLPSVSSKQDYEDAESDAMLRSIGYIRSVMQQSPEVASQWDIAEWRRRLYSRFHDGVLESARYLIYPFYLPRPIRFSLKKYSDAMSILRKYSRQDNVRTSVFYKAIILHQCSVEKMRTCSTCKFKWSKCPLSVLSKRDANTLHALVTKPTQSLSSYARYYRQTPYRTWVELMEVLKDFSAFQPEWHELSYAPHDPDRSITLTRIRQQMDAENPRLFEIYCQSLSNLDTNYLNETLLIPYPKGWQSNLIKSDYGLTAAELRNLLERGDEILNQFRQNEGLPPIQRGFYSEPVAP